MQFSLPKEFGKGVKDVHSDPFTELGVKYMSHGDDNLYRYVRFSEDFVQGQQVQTKPSIYSKTNLSPQTSGGSVYAPAGTRKITEHDATYLTSLAGLPSGEVPFLAHGIIAIVGGAGAGQSGVIQSYSNTTMNIDWYEAGQALKTALDATSDYIIYAPWYVQEADADDSGSVNGVVVSESAKKDEYGFVIENGRERVRAAVALAAGASLSPGDATAEEGEAEPILAADAYDAFATAEYVAAAGSLVWCNIYCKPISQIMFPPEALISAFPPAEAVS